MRVFALSSATLLSIAAGFGGGFVFQAVVSGQPLLAQLIFPTPSRPPKRQNNATEVDAQRFVLVDAGGNVQGEMKMVDGTPEIILYDKSGRAAWRATTRQSGLQPLKGEL